MYSGALAIRHDALYLRSITVHCTLHKGEWPSATLANSFSQTVRSSASAVYAIHGGLGVGNTVGIPEMIESGAIVLGGSVETAACT